MKKKFAIYYTNIRDGKKRVNIVYADNIDDAKEKTLFELDDAINIRRGCYEVLKSNENEK